MSKKNFITTDIGIDLGTSTVLVYVKDKGIVLREPSVVAIDNDTQKIVRIGREAQQMLGRAPENISIILPRGRPPMPSAISSAIEPVCTACTSI